MNRKVLRANQTDVNVVAAGRHVAEHREAAKEAGAWRSWACRFEFDTG